MTKRSPDRTAIMRAVAASPTEVNTLLAATDWLMENNDRTRAQAWATVRTIACGGAARLMCHRWRMLDEFMRTQGKAKEGWWEATVRVEARKTYVGLSGMLLTGSLPIRIVCDYTGLYPRIHGGEILVSATWLLKVFAPERLILVPELGAESPHPNPGD